MSSLLIHSESDDNSSSLSSSDEEQELQQEVANQQQQVIEEEEEGDIYKEPKIPLSTSIFLEKLPKPQQEQLNQQIEEQQQRSQQLPIQRDSSEDKKKNENESIVAKPQPPAIDEEEVTKITIRFQPIGSTPHIQPKVFKISSTSTIATINKFLIKKLKTKLLIYIYIQNSFLPNPDEKIIDLFNLFKTNNELIISYCNTIAFG